jgi:S1-C subfamily serine protease
VTVVCGDSLGSGFSYDIAAAPGYNSVIVTNYHVIEACHWDNGPQVSVTTHGGETSVSKLWSWDEKNDLALIMTQVRLAPLAKATEGKIGDPVIAIGSPQGFSGSVTSGIISNVYTDAYQTDAAINHGNSGGPLLDRHGKVLGVTTLGIGREGLNIAFRASLLCTSLVECAK